MTEVGKRATTRAAPTRHCPSRDTLAAMYNSYGQQGGYGQQQQPIQQQRTGFQRTLVHLITTSEDKTDASCSSE